MSIFVSKRLAQPETRATHFVNVAQPIAAPLPLRQRKASASGDGLSRKESKLAQQLNQYRQQNGLPAIRLSKALSTVANRHVLDLVNTQGAGGLHSWSDAPYDSNNPATYPSMWEAPQRLKTGYPGYGYEIAYWISNNQVKPSDALNGWKGSPSHNPVMLNQGIWQNLKWKAMGVGMAQGYAVVWFGEQRDRTGLPAGA
jgi:uncharacterized protein YkwD